jgi:predicted transposase/invertase (TIGR01784 family)
MLIGLDKQKAKGYQFTSVEVKDIDFRFDGIFLPETADELIYCAEAQFYQATDFYSRFFGKIFAYLEQYDPPNDWRAIVIYPSQAFDTGVHHHYREFFESGRLQRIFLTDLPDELLEKFPLNLLKIIIDSKENV